MYTVHPIVTGAIEENCYLVSSATELLIVDPGAEAEKISAAITQLQKKPIAILLTHAHYDHIGAVEALKARYQLPVYIHENELSWLTTPEVNLSRYSDLGDCLVKATNIYNVGPTELGEFNFSVRETPGHSVGSVSLVFDTFVLVGDALFAGSVGRSDFPGGDAAQLLTSIRQQLFTLPEDYLVYPGHGTPTTIGQEIHSNPFFQ
jgi:glyoxylase-like metal-dependent hydrolase (beta-lactamase superfamily II)